MLLKLFPVPKYLQYPMIGIDISDDHIRYVELLRGQDTVSLGRYGKKYISSSTKDDESGQHLERLAEILSKLKKEEKIEYANVSLPEEQSFFFSLSLPILSHKDIRGAIELKMEDHVPYAPSEVVFDYDVYRVDEKKNEMIIGVAVSPVSVVNDYVSVFQRAGIRPLRFEVEAAAAANAIVPNDDNFYLVVNIGSSDTTLFVVGRGIIWLSDTVKIGGSFFDDAIVKKVKVSEQKAKDLKWAVNLRDTDDAVTDALMPVISSVRDEIGKHYKFWNSGKLYENFGFKRIKKIILCGSQTAVRGLDDYFSASLGINIELADPWSKILSFEKSVPDMTYEESLGYVTAIGLAASLEKPRRIF